MAATGLSVPAEGIVVAAEYLMGRGEGALLVVKDAQLFLLKEGADLQDGVEIVAQLLVNSLYHPILSLLMLRF